MSPRHLISVFGLLLATPILQSQCSARYPPSSEYQIIPRYFKSLKIVTCRRFERFRTFSASPQILGQASVQQGTKTCDNRSFEKLPYSSPESDPLSNVCTPGLEFLGHLSRWHCSLPLHDGFACGCPPQLFSFVFKTPSPILKTTSPPPTLLTKMICDCWEVFDLIINNSPSLAHWISSPHANGSHWKKLVTTIYVVTRWNISPTLHHATLLLQ